VCPCRTCLTLPSSGQPKGYALRLPLMSNVRRLEVREARSQTTSQVTLHFSNKVVNPIPRSFRIDPQNRFSLHMLIAAIILALFGLMAAIFLWLAAAANHSVLQAQYPEYAKRVYRTSHQVVTRQGGPVRMFVLIGTASPNPREPLIFQMRVLALVCVVSIAASALLWVLT